MANVGPFAQGGLNEAFGFTVGARSIGAGEAVANAEFGADLAELAGAITTAIVGEQATDGDAVLGIEGQGGAQEGDGGWILLVRQHAGEGKARVIVNGDVQSLPAGKLRAATATAIPTNIDGKTFSYNDKDDPGKTIIFIDDMAYESIVKDKDWDEIKKYLKGSKDEDILRAEAKQHQEHFKSLVPSIVIKDFGVSSHNPDGSEGRAFYLWKKENPPGKEAATQYLCSTVVKNGVVVLSIMLIKPTVSEDDVFRQLREYTSRFDTLSGDKCAQVLAMPSAP